MAKQVITKLTDDLDGSTADRTVEFALDGVRYTIDLSERNAGRLRKALDAYIAAGTRLGRTPTGGARGAAARSGGAGDESSAIRAWAVENGHEVADRGRISASVLAAYRARSLNGRGRRRSPAA